MLTSKQSDRALPTFITLLVIGVLLMTFDVRLDGGGVVAVLRSGTQAIVSPMQRIASYAVTPIANALDSLSNVASLREQNAALSAQLAESQAALVAVQDDLAKLALLEQIYDLETEGPSWGKPWPTSSDRSTPLSSSTKAPKTGFLPSSRSSTPMAT